MTSIASPGLSVAVISCELLLGDKGMVLHTVTQVYVYIVQIIVAALLIYLFVFSFFFPSPFFLSRSSQQRRTTFLSSVSSPLFVCVCVCVGR
jgi:hypothetical protein